MPVRWDEEWEASRLAHARPRRRAGVGTIFVVVLLLVAVMVVATRWRHWAMGPIPKPGAAKTVTAAELKAGPQDHLHGPFAPCHGPVRVTCMVDGDTIWYAHQKIRVADINAPEIGHPQCDYELDLGNKATARLTELLNAGPFSLDATETRDVDKYGRKLRTITRGGKSLGMVLVGEGLAEAWIGYRRDWCH